MKFVKRKRINVATENSKYKERTLYINYQSHTNNISIHVLNPTDENNNIKQSNEIYIYKQNRTRKKNNVLLRSEYDDGIAERKNVVQMETRSIDVSVCSVHASKKFETNQRNQPILKNSEFMQVKLS